MSESSGPETISSFKTFEKVDDDCLKSCGSALNGTEILIFNPDNTGEGEICYRGRNRFLGYFKNEQETRLTIDKQGFLHSGDLGRLDKTGNLSITGRIKELIVTAGGENVAPIIIENIIKLELPIISNSMVIGDMKKYLSVILALKHDLGKDGSIS